MASITRRTWDQIKAEFILRCGRQNDTVFGAANGRAEYYLTAAYLWIARAFHHPELDSVDTSLALSTSNNSVDISSLTPCIVQGVELRSTGDSFIKMLDVVHFRVVAARYAGTGAPRYCGQHGETLFVEKLPDAAYKLAIYYLDTEPAAPDFGVGVASPVIGRAWDESIMELALLLAHSAVGRHDVAAAHNQIYQLFAGEMPQPRTVQDTQRPVFEAAQLNQALGGANG